jgi:hypothetical protein
MRQRGSLSEAHQTIYRPGWQRTNRGLTPLGSPDLQDQAAAQSGSRHVVKSKPPRQSPVGVAPPGR